MLPVDARDAGGVDEDQHHERVDTALLGEPEAQFEAAERELVQEVDQEDAAPEGDGEPDDEANGDQAQVVAPVARFLDVVPLLRRGRSASPLLSDSNHYSLAEQQHEHGAVDEGIHASALRQP